MPIIVPSATNESTFLDMTLEVAAHLQGYTKDQELATHLTTAVDPDDLTLRIGNGQKASPGLVQIDDELIWVDSVDQNTSTLNVAPYGRGYQGTSAAGHDVNSRVTVNPRFPRWRIKRAINDTLQAVSKDIRSVVADEFTMAAGVYAYELPAGTERVVEASAANPDATDKLWVPLDRFDVDLQADTDVFPSGAAIQIFNPVPAGFTVRVIVEKNPELMVNDDDVFVDTTGFEAQLFDVLVLGAVYRLVGFLDPARLDFQSAEAQTFDDKQPVGAATQVARYFYSLYRQRLDEEISRYRSQFKPRLRRTR